MNVTSFDFEDKLEITGIVLEETKTYPVHHDATIIEEDGTEVRIAPLDVQYQNASIWGTPHYQFCWSDEQLYPEYCRILSPSLHAGRCSGLL